MRAAGEADHEWHVQRRVVNEEPVLGLAVVADDGDERPVVEPLLPQPAEERAQVRAGELDLAVVRAPGVARAVRLRRGVRVVRIAQVNPREEGRGSSVFLKPPNRLANDFVAGALDIAGLTFSYRDRSKLSK